MPAKARFQRPKAMPDVRKSKFYESLDDDVKRVDAAKELHDMDGRKSVTEHTHYFTEKGREATCNCGWGLFLDPQDKIKEGHLYRNGKFII